MKLEHGKEYVAGDERNGEWIVTAVKHPYKEGQFIAIPKPNRRQNGPYDVDELGVQVGSSEVCCMNLKREHKEPDRLRVVTCLVRNGSGYLAAHNYRHDETLPMNALGSVAYSIIEGLWHDGRPDRKTIHNGEME